MGRELKVLMANRRKKAKSLIDLDDAINNLELGVKAFHSGQTSAYRIVATQLRILLCDSIKGRDNSLLPRIFGHVRLHPILASVTQELDREWEAKFGYLLSERVDFQLPGVLRFDGKGGSTIEELFDERREPIDLVKWLDQMTFSKEITIRELIRSVANKEAAHSDEDYGRTLRKTQSVKLPDQDIHVKFIVGIGEYILKVLKSQMTELDTKYT